MSESIARIDTPAASRLIKRLCTHWKHKFEVEFDDTHGVVPFDVGVEARLDAASDHLQASITAPDQATLEKIQDVLLIHLQRMARAGEIHATWQTPSTPD